MQLEHNIEVFGDQLQVLQTKHKVTDYRLAKMLDITAMSVRRWKKAEAGKNKALPKQQYYDAVCQIFTRLEANETISEIEESLKSQQESNDEQTVDILQQFKTEELCRELKRRGYSFTISM